MLLGKPMSNFDCRPDAFAGIFTTAQCCIALKGNHLSLVVNAIF